VSGIDDLFAPPKPIVRVIDFEATGLERECKVVEVGHCDFDPIARTIGRPESYLCGGIDQMPPDTRAVHHIRLEDLAGLPPYDRWCLYEQAARAGVVAFAAHSADFEAQHILGSIPLVCTFKAAVRVWPDAPSHSVFGLLYWLEDQGLVAYDRQLAHPPHRAGPDAYATAVLLQAIYAAGYEGRDLIAWTREPALLPRCPLGDWRGHKWEECDPSFLEWILRKIHDREDVRFCAARELERRERPNE
jgi:exodeoxyribonuclease X